MKHVSEVISGVLAVHAVFHLWNDDLTLSFSQVMLLYMVVDIFPNLYRKKYDFVLHHLCAIVLIFTTIQNGAYHMATPALLMEVSSILLSIARITKSPFWFASFTVVFFIFRILVCPYVIMVETLDEIGTVCEGSRVCTFANILAIFSLCGLNFFWFLKMVKILLERERTYGKRRS